MPHNRPHIGMSHHHVTLLGSGGGGGGADITAPIITSSASLSVNENDAFSHTLTANESVTWSMIGGADQALFGLSGSTLSMSAKNYEAPTDANTDNVYEVQVRATDGASNTSDQTISVSVLDVLEVTRNSPLSEIVTGAVFDLDATLAASYSGSGQTWNNIITSPADGAAQADYHPHLGDTGTASTDDPTFNGTAGDAAAYWGFDGGDDFQMQAMTNFMRDLHKTTGGTDFTFVWALRTPPSGRMNLLYTGDAGVTRPGIVAQIRPDTATPYIGITQSGDSSSINLIYKTLAGSLTFDQICLVGMGYDHATGTARAWFNSATATETSVTLNTCTTDAFYVPWLFGLNPSNGSRAYAMSAFNKLLTDSEFADVAAHYELRHGRAYV